MNKDISSFMRRVHETAVSKGFWDPSASRSPVATKIALIHTEITEVLEALDIQAPVYKIAEEIADVAIRTADLLAAIDVPIKTLRSFNPTFISRDPSETDYEFVYAEAANMHDTASRATQADRKDQEQEVIGNLLSLIRTCFWLAAEIGVEDFWSTILEKDLKNTQRPERHGRKY